MGRMVISDPVTSREVAGGSTDIENWCDCIDGTPTKENYIDSIRKAGFSKIEILDERSYMEMDNDGIVKI